MHRVLFVVDVLFEIFAHLQPIRCPIHRDKLPSRTSIAAVARTCKTFYEPAMDLLWADMDEYGITPLLGCVPRLHPLIYSRDRKIFCSDGVEPLSEHEARLFLRHATRVRSFFLSILSVKHSHLLTILPIETYVFPRLLALRVVWEDPSMRRKISLSHFFLSPVLRGCFHLLENLSIGLFTVRTTDELTLLCEAVRSCKQLKHLECGPLDYGSWKHLSNLPTLDTVMIYQGTYKVHLGRANVDFSPSQPLISVWILLQTLLPSYNDRNSPH
ncbi:hypothetical protein K503DRAFT_226638 [Rhizopogon vinicolor AM-OR11-026]|uniref:F-box domain-containing protein n=1 Tax=Rhizopogon vinicolor AM-OR11-026 TaxID=1314800 RepID=A0A1B7MY81_9AGAM|nr:hypothetical protein K503DRAFT_226638 [Rhizopogon vinicolor AM-OR11-026]